MKSNLVFYVYCIFSIQAHEIDDQIDFFKKTYLTSFKNRKTDKNYLVQKCDQENFCLSKSVSESISFASKSLNKNFTKKHRFKNKRSISLV
jgi:hypothetical protein